MTWRFFTLFWRQVVRQAWRHPLLTVLNVFSIALGVAVFLAIQIANRSALESFQAAANLTSGRADLVVRGEIPDTLLPALAAVPGVRTAAPVVEGILPIEDERGEYLRLLGVDPLAGAEALAFRLENADASALNFEAWLGDPDAVAVQAGVGAGDGTVTVRTDHGPRTLRTVFVLRPDERLGNVDRRVAAMDIGWAQELLGRVGTLTSVQIQLHDPGAADAVLRDVQALLPADVTVDPPAARDREMQTMLSAFQLNLTAMSLVSLVVGMFLIFNSVGATVVRRRTEIAVLRACGATRSEIRALFLGGAALDAAAGAALGLIGGPLLARLASPAMAGSISSLYEVVRLDHLHLGPEQAVAAFLAGILAAVLAAWAPAGEAARCDPARILHPGAAAEVFHPLRPLGLVLAAVLLGAAVGLSFWTLHGGSKLLGFGAAAAVLAGFSLFVPWLILAVARLVRPFGRMTRLAADHLARALHRNTVTVAALAAAVAMTISVTVMIASFRASVERWIGYTLVADLYVAPAANDIVGLQAFLPDEALAWMHRQPEVERVGTFRERTVRFQDAPVSLAVVSGDARGELEFLDGSLPRAAEDVRAGRAVAVSESFANRFGIRGGQEITVPAAAGVARLPVGGVYRDFTRDGGTVLMDRTLYEQFWPGDTRLHSLSVLLRPDGDAEKLGQRFRAEVGDDGQFAIYNNRSLRQRVFEIFDQTFAVTAILRAIAIIVAVIGVLFSFSVLVIEREREIGVLRAVGASKAQVLGLFLREAFLLGLTATLSGVVSGSALAVVLTGVINKAFFGWTIALTFPVEALLAAPLWLIPAVILAAVLPGWRGAGIPPARAVRFE